MSKVTIKAECIAQNNTKNGSNATFVVQKELPKKDNAIAMPAGSLPQNSKVINVTFDDDTAKQYTPGKTYTITIE